MTDSKDVRHLLHIIADVRIGSLNINLETSLSALDQRSPSYHLPLLLLAETSTLDTPYLVVANGQFIREFSLSGQGFGTIVSGLKNARGLTYHYR